MLTIVLLFLPGMGYRSGAVTSFNFLLSPHGRQPPFGLDTIWRGDANGLLDFLIMPIFSISENFFLAGARRRARAKTGRCLVGMK